MYQIPFAQGIILVDCRWKSYDPDQFMIYSMEWEGGITIPKCVWWNLQLTYDQIALSERRNWKINQKTYIHEYIFGYMCAFEPIEYD